MNGAQLWCVDATTGDANALTVGLTNYGDLAVSGDAQRLIAQHEVQSGNLWRIPLEGGRAVRLTSNPIEGDVDGYSGVAVFANGDVLFGMLNGTGLSVLRGGHREAIILPRQGEAFGAPALSPDGRTIAFVVRSTANVSQIRLAERDGSNIRPVRGLPDQTHTPQFSSDGQSLIYTQDGGLPSIWTIPVVGGDPKPLADVASHCAISPNGEELACFVRGGLGILSVNGGPVRRSFPSRERLLVRSPRSGGRETARGSS